MSQSKLRWIGSAVVALTVVSFSTDLWGENVDANSKHDATLAVPSEGRRAPAADPFELVSSTSLLKVLEDLTRFEEHSGWRTCGSAGERQAFDFIERKLAGYSSLAANGLEVDRQSLRTIAGVEIHEARLEIEVGQRARTVPADAIAGHPYSLPHMQLYDSDGSLTDLEKNPVTAEGQVRVLTSLEDLTGLAAGELEGQIAVVDFALIDTALHGTLEAYDRISPVFEASAAGVVAVTSDSLVVGESHGSFALDSSVFNYIQSDPAIPVLITRVEDLEVAGVSTISELHTITGARMTWDVDIISPGQSGNVVARIPGIDSSHATILSAHLDSPNCPGALDNGSGSASLLEIARVLDRSRTIPPVDVYLVWFGCHEKGLFGSPHFAATYQEVLDRTLGMIELDAMGRPLEGLADPVNLESWSYSLLGDDTLPFPDFLQDQADDREIQTLTWDFHWLLSDITGFVPYDVPNALTDNLDFPSVEQIGSAHYTMHWHTPNDRIEHARAEAQQFETLTRVMLSAALDTGALAPDLRVAPSPSARAVFIATHTESVHIAPFLFTDLGTILAWEGLDLDLVPHGEALTAAHLEDAAMVVVLPVHDYPHELANADLYDEAWSETEISVLTSYVDGGGLLVLTNSASRLGPFARPRESNEDHPDMNAIAGEFDLQYLTPVEGGEAEVTGTHELVAGVEALGILDGNAIGLSRIGGAGTVLADVPGSHVMVLVEHGANGGEVLALGDIGMLVSRGGQPTNFTFWQNLVRYAAGR